MSEADDREFVIRAMARLRGGAPPAGMAGRLLDAYDAARPRGGRLARLAELLWPGMPLWAPGAALAMSLLLGIGVGAALPTPMAERTAFSLEEPPSVSIENLLTEER
jgi:hypothetical protein